MRTNSFLSRGPLRPMHWVALSLIPLPVLFILGSLYLTAPLESRTDLPANDLNRPPMRQPESLLEPEAVAGTPRDATEPPVWPDDRLNGPKAKELLLRTLLIAQAELHSHEGYTGIFRKQERIRGELRPEQVMRMKIRHEPFSVYLKFLEPRAGKEVVYCDGRYDNHVVGHNGDWSRLLVPRLKVAPDDPIALADNRHPITDAGLRNLIDKLVRFRRLDLTDEEAVTILDRVTDEQGRTWLRSIHTHPHQRPERPFAQVEVLYHPESWIPFQITSYDWPEPGQDPENLLLGERYTYEDVDFSIEFQDLDFDPANPDYAFSRF